MKTVTDRKIRNDDNKKMKRNALIKIGIIGLFTVIVLIFGSIAWFTMNREVEGGSVQMASNDLPFEIKTSGSVVPNDDIISSMGYNDGTPVTGGTTSENAGDIKWMLETDDIMAGSGLRPGTSGSLYFTIVPKQRDESKNLEVSYSLTVKGYRLTDEMRELIAAENAKKLNGEPYNIPEVALSDLILLSDDTGSENYSKALDYIKGHIMFFSDSGNTGRFTIEETKTLTFSSESDKEVPLHWVWADTLGNLVLNDPSITSVCTGDEKTALVTFIQESPSLFFDLSYLDDDMLDEDNKLISTVLGAEISDYYPVLNLAYNEADQCIGVDVQYIMIELVIDGRIVDAG